MTHFTDEQLMAHADGELPAAEARALDIAVKADPALAARLEAFRAARSAAQSALLAAFPASPDPRDADLAALIMAAEPVRGAAANDSALKAANDNGFWRGALRPRHAAAWGGLAAAWGGLAAAAFVAGLLIAPVTGLGTGGMGQGADPLAAANGAVSDPALIRVLDQRLAADGPDAAGRAIGLTYRNTDGQWCRTFTASDTGVAGLACREDNAWSLRALSPFEAPAGEVRTAGSDTPASILAAVDDSLADDPVDAAAEARAREEGWR